MTEFRNLKSIVKHGLLPGGGNVSGTKQRNVNNFLPIDALLLAHEQIRPTANVALVLSKATLEKNPHIQFCLSKNGYFLTKESIPSGLFSAPWNVRDGSCVCYKLFDVPYSTAKNEGGR